MIHKRSILILSATAILAFSTWLLIPSEPSYNGHRLSYWLDVIDRANHNMLPLPAAEQKNVDTATDAVQHIGAKAIPKLLAMIRAHHSPWQFKLQQFASNQLSIHLRLTDTDEQNYSAALGFVSIGTNARPAIPALITILGEKYSPMSFKCTSAILSSFGPDADAAVPTLIRILANTPGNSFAAINARTDALSALAHIHTRPAAVVPVLTNLLTQPFPPGEAIEALGNYGPEAKSAIPLLLNLTSSADKWTRLSAIEAVRKIDPAEAALHQAQFDSILQSSDQ